LLIEEVSMREIAWCSLQLCLAATALLAPAGCANRLLVFILWMAHVNYNHSKISTKWIPRVVEWCDFDNDYCVSAVHAWSLLNQISFFAALFFHGELLERELTLIQYILKLNRHVDSQEEVWTGYGRRPIYHNRSCIDHIRFWLQSCGSRSIRAGGITCHSSTLCSLETRFADSWATLLFIIVLLSETISWKVWTGVPFWMNLHLIIFWNDYVLFFWS
jgi:hypothetical protein